MVAPAPEPLPATVSLGGSRDVLELCWSLMVTQQPPGLCPCTALCLEANPAVSYLPEGRGAMMSSGSSTPPPPRPDESWLESQVHIDHSLGVQDVPFVGCGQGKGLGRSWCLKCSQNQKKVEEGSKLQRVGRETGSRKLFLFFFQERLYFFQR